MVLTSYGRSSGFCVDPIEKKPLNHFLPGTSVLSFGTAGCNLQCKFCQNWRISRSREIDTLSDRASPQTIARVAAEAGCESVAFTYNDPVVFHEYAIDVARACHERGLKTVAVTAGYVCAEPRAEFYRHIDAANIDLKAFTDRFYRNVCAGQLGAVLETLQYVYHETDTWLELTTLLIPGENDADEEIAAMTRWVVDHLGPEVPMHFTAFRPEWMMTDHPATPASALTRARTIALDSGIRYAYTGNVSDEKGATTFCHVCGEPLVVRAGYEVCYWRLDEAGRCRRCGSRCAGIFAPRPGTWGARSLPLHLAALQEPGQRRVPH